jgi:hypothetical protein
MAISGTEVEFVGPGIRANIAENRSYVQNMVFRNNSWEVRQGFGTIGEFSTSLSRYTLTPGVLEEVEGYRTHVGSYLMKTNFGHRQIISIFHSLVWNNQGVTTGNIPRSPLTDTKATNTYIVSIYDLNSRERWEELIYQYTPQITGDTKSSMPFSKGYYQTNRTRTYATNIIAPKPEQISFAEFNDLLYFGNKSMGFYYYRPAAFIGNECKAQEVLHSESSTIGTSESSLIFDLKLTPGSFSDAYEYLTIIAGIKGVSQLGNRIVYITDNKIYFSDNNFPNSVISGHFTSIPSEAPITACREINGNLLIFTRNETFLYQPTASFFVNQGQLTKLSESVGCLSLNSITKFMNTLAWVSSTGVYINSGSLEITEISENVRPFFENYLSNPLSSFNIGQGKANQDYKLPKISHQLEEEQVTVVYSSVLKALMVTIPKERITLVHNQNNEWSTWNYDSMAFSNQEGGESAITNKVGIRDHMVCDQIVADELGIYSIGVDPDSDFNKIIFDYAATANPATGAMEPDVLRAQAFSTYFITEYGRGGGLDRSIHDEDYRYGIGEWREDGTTSVAYKPAAWRDGSVSGGEMYFDFIIGKPQSVKEGWTLDGITMPSDGGVLVPIQIRIPQILSGTTASGTSRVATTTKRTQWVNACIHQLFLQFKYDSSHWIPFMDPGTPRIKAIFKTPMEVSGAGYGNASLNYLQIAGREIQLYNFVTGGPDPLGNQIRIAWDPAAAGRTAATANFNDLGNTFTMGQFQMPTDGPGTAKVIGLNESLIPINNEEIKTLFWIPFMRNPANNTEPVSSMAIEDMNGVYADGGGGAPNSFRSVNYWYGFSSLGQSTSLHNKDNVAQGVDWAYASEPIGLDQGKQIKARGLYSQVKSHGMSGEHFDNGWSNNHVASRNYRLYNSVVAADNTEWMGQVVDQPRILPSPGGEPTAIKESDSTTFLGFPDVNNPQENSIRTRVRHVPAPGPSGIMKYKVFGSDAMTWGNDDSATHGTVLIDDPQFGTIAESASTRGEWVNWMFFGYVLDKAEKLILKSSKAVLRAVSGRRRKGHSGGQDSA